MNLHGIGLVAAILVVTLIVNIPESKSQAVGDDVIAKVAFCLEETAARKILEAQRDKGYEISLSVFNQSQVCFNKTIHFRIVREVAKYDMRDGETWYVVEVTSGTRHVFVMTPFKIESGGRDA